MLDHGEINRLVGNAAVAALRHAEVKAVHSRDALDADGQEALKVTIVIGPDDTSRISGDDALDALVGIQRDLQASGEQRFAYVYYATEDELSGDDDAQP